jgi:pilus assembly protein CpaF
MLQACNTGHDGSLSTVHANSPADALSRIETLALSGGIALPLPAIRAQLTSAIDAVVQVVRGADGRRRVSAVAELGPARRPPITLWSATGGFGSPPARPPRRFDVDIEQEWHGCTPPSPG